MIAGLAALALVIIITSGAGPGLDPDAMAYMGAATSLAHDGTLRVPSSSWDSADSTSALTTWPPGFSVAMAIARTAGAGPLASARIVNATAAFITAAVFFLLLEESAGTGPAVAAVAGAFGTVAIVGVHLSALSEPLFLACLMLTLAAMVHAGAAEPNNRSARPRLNLWHRPLIAGLPAGLAVMVRYAGVCAPAAVVLWFLFARKEPLRARIAAATEAAAAPVVLIAAWVVRSARVSDGTGGLEVSLYGHLGPTLREGIQTLADWLAPSVDEPLVRAILAVIVATVICAAVVNGISRLQSGSHAEDGRDLRSHRSNPQSLGKKLFDEDKRSRALVLLKADALLLGCYLVVLIAARLFVGDAIPFDFRLLAPAILLAEVAIAVSVAWYLKGATPSLRRIVMAVGVIWLAASATRSTGDAIEAITDGDDFASRDWRSSPALDWVRTRSAGWTLFTNWPAAIYFRTQRMAHDIPQSLDTAELREFGEVLESEHGAFLAFTSYNTDYPPSDSIAHKLGLVEAKEFSDAKMWVSPDRLPK